MGKSKLPLDGIIRELKEECSIDLLGQNLRGPEIHHIRNQWEEFILYSYFISLPKRPKVILSHEHSQYQWLSWSEAKREISLLERHLSPDIFSWEKLRIENINMMIAAIQQQAKDQVGLKRKSVELLSYSPNWPAVAEMVIGQLKDKIPSILLLEHIGSTSIVGACAKPIIDLLLVLNSSQKVNRSIDELEQLGFIYKGDGVARVHGSTPDPHRHYFAFYNRESSHDYLHLQLASAGSPEIQAKLLFRDRLRQSPHLVSEYNSIKQKLRDDQLNRQQYTIAKTHFIEKVLRLSI